MALIKIQTIPNPGETRVQKHLGVCCLEDLQVTGPELRTEVWPPVRRMEINKNKYLLYISYMKIELNTNNFHSYILCTSDQNKCKRWSEGGTRGKAMFLPHTVLWI